MSSFTNNTRQTLSQSPCEHSPFIIKTSSHTHTYNMSHTASPGVPKKSARQHFEEFGLSIPFVKHGQKLLHARSTEELETKSIIDLKRIVNSHYGKKGPKLIKSLVTKTAIAAWIERVETLALGPHPESRLPCRSCHDAYG